ADPDRARRRLHRLRQVREVVRARGSRDQGAAARARPRQGRRALPQGLGGEEQGRRLADSRADRAADPRTGGRQMKAAGAGAGAGAVAAAAAAKSMRPGAPVPPAKAQPSMPGREAIRVKGRWRANRWLWLRRLVQASILALFLAGPWAGLWIVEGNLSSSLTLGVLPLTDPFVLLQTMATRNWPELSALVGVAVVLVAYLLVGGRAFCAWVCPMNVVTDGAGWLRRRLGLRGA